MKGFAIRDGGISWVTVDYGCMGGASVRTRVDFELELNIVRGFLSSVLLRYFESVQLMPRVGFVVVFEPEWGR